MILRRRAAVMIHYIMDECAQQGKRIGPKKKREQKSAPFGMRKLQSDLYAADIDRLCGDAVVEQDEVGQLAGRDAAQLVSLL